MTKLESRYVLIEETEFTSFDVVDCSTNEQWLIEKANRLNENVRNYNLSISRKVEFYNSKRDEFIKDHLVKYIPEKVIHPDNKCWTEQDHIDWKKAKDGVRKRNKEAIAKIASDANQQFLKDYPLPESTSKLEVNYYVVEIKESSIDKLTRK
jgi:hypothetical protein